MQRFERPEDILAEHFPVRMECYRARKLMLHRRFEADWLENRNKSDFIGSILRGDINVLGAKNASSSSSGWNEVDLLAELRRKGFATKGEIVRVREGEVVSKLPVKGTVEEKDFQYLLGMSIQSFTEEKVSIAIMITMCYYSTLLPTCGEVLLLYQHYGVPS